MFNHTNYESMYRRMLGPLAQPVMILQNTGSDFVEYPQVMAHVSRYRESDLVNNSTLQIGDLKLIMMAEELPLAISDLTLKDRFVIDNLFYSIVHWDVHTRTVGANRIAIEATIRGGGMYAPSNYDIVDELGNQMITEHYEFTITTETANA